MNKSTKKWLSIKLSSLILIPFMTWFIINFVAILNSDYNEIIIFLNEQSSKILLSVFVFLPSCFCLVVSVGRLVCSWIRLFIRWNCPILFEKFVQVRVDVTSCAIRITSHCL